MDNNSSMDTNTFRQPLNMNILQSPFFRNDNKETLLTDTCDDIEFQATTAGLQQITTRVDADSIQSLNNYDSIVYSSDQQIMDVEKTCNTESQFSQQGYLSPFVHNISNEGLVDKIIYKKNSIIKYVRHDKSIPEQLLESFCVNGDS